jgi:hypothetical protein
MKGVRSFRKLQKQFSRFQNISESFRVFQTGFNQVSERFRRFQKLLKQFQKMFRTVLESFLKHCRANRLHVPKPAKIQTPLSGIVERQFRRRGDLRWSMQITFTDSPGDKAPQQTEAYAHCCVFAI